MTCRFLMGLVLVSLASPAATLSCMRPDVARSYTEAAAAEGRYMVVHGTLRFDEARLPAAVLNESPPSTKIPAHLSGKALSNGQFNYPFDRKITLDVLCFGPWCGGAENGLDYLVFVQVTAEGYTLTVNPCGGQAFANPTSEDLRRVERCNAEGPCAPQP